MKKLAFILPIAVVLGFASLGNATTLTWDSNYTNGLISSITTTSDLIFTDFNQTIELTESQYTFMLGDQTHSPTQGVIVPSYSSYGTSIFMTYDFSGWYWSESLHDWTYSEPYLSIILADSPRGFAEISHQSDPVIWHIYSDFMFYAYTWSQGYLTHAQWGDNILTLPYNGRDIGHWDITGVTFPEIPAEPTPEPITMLLLSFGLVGLASIRKRFNS